MGKVKMSKGTTQITFGKGTSNLVVAMINDSGRYGITIMNSDTERTVGDFVPDDVKGNLKKGDVVLWFESMDGARVLQDAVNGIIHNMMSDKYKHIAIKSYLI